MEPAFSVGGVDEDFDAIIAGELRLLDPKIRRDGEAVRALLHDDFREFGSSGSVWDRESIVQATESSADGITATDLHPAWLGPDAVLLTYTARWRHLVSLRTSVWVRGHGSWRLLHHQGTLVPAE